MSLTLKRAAVHLVSQHKASGVPSSACAKQVPPMPPAQARKVIEAELGAPLEDVFEEIDLEKPLGSASIAQAWRPNNQLSKAGLGAGLIALTNVLCPCFLDASACTGTATSGAQVHKARLRRPPGRKPAARRPEEGEPSGLRLSLRAQPSWSTVGGFGGGWVPGNGAKRSSAKLGAQPDPDPVMNGGGPGYMGRNGGSEAGEGGQDGVSAESNGGTLETSGGPPSTSWRVAANQELLLGTGRSADAGVQAPRSGTCARRATHTHSSCVALQVSDCGRPHAGLVCARTFPGRPCAVT